MRFTPRSASLASVLLLATCSLPTLNALSLEPGLDTTSLTERSKFSGFRLVEDGDLDDWGFPTSCNNALTQTIFCDEYISAYGDEPTWRGYIDTNETSYESICDASCGASIRSYWDGIVTECAGYIYQENATLNLRAGWFWEAWNETCYYDPESGRNCNEIIDEFYDHNGTCTYCNVEHYKMMQRSPYSAYDYLYQDDFKDVNEKCGLNNDLSFPLWPATAEDVACTSTGYEIQEGDTCASVAEKYNISSEAVRESCASAFGWVDCDEIGAGWAICIPQSSQSGEVVPGDDKSAPSTDTNSSTSATQTSSSSASTASSASGRFTSSQSTVMVSMATSGSSGTSGAKLTAQTAGGSASATPSVSADNVSAASMVRFGRSQIVAVVAALMLC